MSHDVAFCNALQNHKSIKKTFNSSYIIKNYELSGHARSRQTFKFIETKNLVGRTFAVDIEVKQFLKQISSHTSHFCEDETISSPQEVLGAQAGN